MGRGKLVYTPNTPAYNRLVERVNETFQELKKVQELADFWLTEISPPLTVFLHRLEDALVNATAVIGNSSLFANVTLILLNATEDVKR